MNAALGNSLKVLKSNKLFVATNFLIKKEKQIQVSREDILKSNKSSRKDKVFHGGDH